MEEMNAIDCNPGDADIGYDEFALLEVVDSFSCADLYTVAEI